MEQNKKQKKWKSWILALLSSIALIYYFQVSTGNFAGIVFLFALFYFYSHMEMVTEARAKICAFAGGAVCSMALVFGKVGRSSESILDALSRFSDSVIKDEHTADVALNGYYTVKNLLVLFVTFVGLGIVCYHLLLKTAFLLRHVNITMQERQEKRNGKIFLLSFCSILICWMPCFLLNFPGVLTYDSINQISQIEGSIPLNNHHPPIHTAMIALFYNAGRFFFHSSQIGTAFCSMAQMILLALIYSELIVLIYRSGFHKICSGLVWAYFALLPLHAVYAVTMWKDILSAASVLWFSMTVYKMFVWKEAGSLVLIQYVVSGTMLALFRSNGSIVFILCIPYFIFLCRKKMRNVIFLILPVFCFLIVKGPVYDFFHVQKTTDIVERISIPMQHIARVVVNCEQELEADGTGCFPGRYQTDIQLSFFGSDQKSDVEKWKFCCDRRTEVGIPYALVQTGAEASGTVSAGANRCNGWLLVSGCAVSDAVLWRLSKRFRHLYIHKPGRKDMEKCTAVE